jgi:acetylornithine/N-succinyldiaminopimelate aminotransferase
MTEQTDQNSADYQAVMPTYGRIDLAFVRGEGSYLFTEAGQAYLDCATGIAVNALGHGHPALLAALHEQTDLLWHTSNLYRIPQQEKLAGRLARAAGLEQVFFCNSGAEANEAAVKMARRFHYRQQQPERVEILCAGGAFHGRTLAMLAATDRPAFREGFGPMPGGFAHVPFGNLNALRAALGPQTAAIMLEPVQGEGGAIAAPPGYLEGVAEAAREFGTLLIADEVQTGMGRTGYLFAFQAAGIQPDLVVLAKGLGGGFPVGAVIARAEIGEAMGPGSHGSTFGGNPLATAVANALMSEVEKEPFLKQVRARSAQLHDGLDRLAERYPDLVAGRRGMGLLAGLQLADSLPVAELNNRLRARQVLCVPAAENVLRMLPPLTISEEEINQLLSLLGTCLADGPKED